MTPPEVQLWARLKGVEPAFRRQHPIGPYVLDFYCTRARLAVEIDGFIHETADHPERDERRDAWLEARGVTVLRIPASELWKDPDSVADSICRTAVAATPPQSLRASSPARGGAAEASLLPCEAGEGDHAQHGGGGAAP